MHSFGGDMVFLPCRITTFINENEDDYLESNVKYTLDGMEEFRVVNLTKPPTELSDSVLEPSNK